MVSVAQQEPLVPQVSADLPVCPVCVENQDSLAAPDPVERRDPLERVVRTEHVDHLVPMDPSVQLDNPDSPETRDHLAKTVYPDWTVAQETRDHPDHQDDKDLPDLLETWDHPDHLDQVDPLDNEESEVNPDLLVSVDPRDHEELMVPQECKDPRERRDPLVPRETRAGLDFPDFPDQADLPEPMERLDQLDHPERPDLEDQPDPAVTMDNPDQTERVVHLDNLDNAVPLETMVVVDPWDPPDLPDPRDHPEAVPPTTETSAPSSGPNNKTRAQTHGKETKPTSPREISLMRSRLCTICKLPSNSSVILSEPPMPQLGRAKTWLWPTLNWRMDCTSSIPTRALPRIVWRSSATWPNARLASFQNQTPSARADTSRIH